MRKNVTIRIDEKLVQKAKEIGLNISKISENALKEIIERLESPKCSKEHGNCSNNTNLRAGSLAWTGHEPPKLGVAGSNPVPPAIRNVRYW